MIIPLLYLSKIRTPFLLAKFQNTAQKFAKKIAKLRPVTTG